MAKWKIVNKFPSKDCVACGRCCWKENPACAKKHLTRVGKKYYCEFYNDNNFPQICANCNNFDIKRKSIEEWWTFCYQQHIK